jgi:hypothetical protein
MTSVAARAEQMGISDRAPVGVVVIAATKDYFLNFTNNEPSHQDD